MARSSSKVPLPSFLYCAVRHEIALRPVEPVCGFESHLSAMYEQEFNNRQRRLAEEEPLNRAPTHPYNQQSNNNTSAADTVRRNINLAPSPKDGVFFEKCFHHLIPARFDIVHHPSIRRFGHSSQQQSQRTKYPRSMQRRIFLLLTEPDTSVASAVFFVFLIISITAMNVVMIMQTMQNWQYTPTDCRSCGGPISYVFDDDDSIRVVDKTIAACVCPPTPLAWTVTVLNGLIYFFTIEWTLRVLTFCPARHELAPTVCGRMGQWLAFLTSTTTVLDALAIFPYYVELEFQTNSLMSLRLFRLFRVFQLVRLGQYNATFTSLSAVLVESVLYIKILLGVLLFLAAFFGSVLYWLEKGDWKFYEATQSYQFVRMHPVTNQPSISPFTSIPQAFWFFAVTSSSTGYGDMVPFTTAGKYVTTMAMLAGVLVIAFPVSVFSDLWSKQLRRVGAIADLDEDDDDDDDDNDEDGTNTGARFPNHTLPTAAAAQGSSVESTEPILPLPPVAAWKQPTTYAPATFDNRQMPVVHTSFADANHVVMHKDDLATLVAHMQSIHETQREIRIILRKYKDDII